MRRQWLRPPFGDWWLYNDRQRDRIKLQRRLARRGPLDIEGRE
jgi:hypothetical protein